ncbi:MAG: hypothetical protein ACI4U5_01845, partial [Bacilli bacterium]
MKKSKLLVISALALSGVLASCGGSKTDTSTQTPTSSEAPATSEVVEKVTVRTGVGMVKSSFNAESGELSTDIG